MVRERWIQWSTSQYLEQLEQSWEIGQLQTFIAVNIYIQHNINIDLKILYTLYVKICVQQTRDD